MLVEFSIIPIGQGIHLSEHVAEVVKIVETSGLAHELLPTGTCVEGGWDEIMGLLKRCHEQARKRAARVILTIKIDDKEGARDMITRNVLTVEEKLGRTAGQGCGSAARPPG